MKKLCYALCALGAVWSCALYTVQEAGIIRGFVVDDPGRTTHFNITCIEDKIDYVAGGITIVYAVDMFAAAPNVQISIMLKDRPYATTETFSAVVTANSTTSTTIRVNVDNDTTISEAATNDVTVHIFATGTKA